MLKKLISLFILLLLLAPSVLTQYNTASIGAAPPWMPLEKYEGPTANLENVNTRAFSYSSTGLTASTLFKYFVGTPGAVTVVGTVKPNFFGNGDYANPTGVWKFYICEQVVAPYTIYEVDTTTGNITAIGGITGLTAGHTPIMLEWDHTTNQFYVFSSNSSVSSGQLYTMNWTTRVCTPVGPANLTSPAAIAGGFNVNGTLFAFDLVNDNVWKINKGTGISTLVGPSGYTGNYGQDAGFDRSDWNMYWAACGGVVGLRQIDTATGASTQIGTFPYTQVLATGFITAPGPSIVHSPLPSTENLTGPYVVNAQIIPQGSPINPTYTKVHWSRNNTTITDSVSMTNTGGNNWTANIPGNGTAATYRYYIRAIDNIGRVVTSPPGAPANLHMFVAGPDNIKPVITHTPLGNQPLATWPATVTATVVDPSDWGGLDSVWVRWYKNTPSTGTIHLKLVAGANNTFSAAFNSTNVNVGDSIFYRIIAQDNSSAHNKDSTTLNKFYIINQITKCIGTATTAVGYPFYTFYMDSKTDMLYLASEIQAPGTGMLIQQIGFTIASAASQPMNGFQIKMQNTSLTTLSGFVTTGWTTVYTGTYTVPGTGLRYITLQNPFQYYSAQNLLVEICFNNSSYTSNSTVNSDPAVTTRHWHRHADLTSGDGCTDNTMTGTATGGRPNVCFIGEPIVGIADPNIQLPKAYSLSQNYPNPFNPSTKISYSLPKAGDVSITVFDITGKEVARLVNTYKQAGTHEVEFDASTLSSGMYIYRIESGTFTETKKMVLVK